MYERKCTQCHNPHDTSSAAKYLAQWSRSRHGDVSAGARVLYDFKTMGSFKSADQEFTDTAQKAVCVRCHTSTGYINYVTSNFTDIRPFAGPGYPVVRYDYTKTYADNSKVSPDLTREITACNVCHVDEKGATYSYKLRSVAAGTGVTVYYNYSGSKNSGISQGIRGNSVVFPDAGASNICIVCHSGRENGDVIKMASVRSIDFSNVSRIGSHDRAAAANMFRKSGFEFYSSVSMYSSTSYMHDIIGMDTTRTNTASTPQTFSGKNADSRLLGPCVGCHMNSDATHSFTPLTGINSDWIADVSQPFGTNAITGIVSKTCVNCHDSSKIPKLENTWTPSLLQAERDRYRAAMSAFWYVLQYTLASNSTPTDASKIIGPANAKISPTSLTHWFNSTLGTKAVVRPWLANNNLNTDVRMGFYDTILGNQSLKTGAFNMGAAFNYTMLVADPGAYVHNRRYIKKLIYDSIDWLDDGLMNQSVYYTFTDGMPKTSATGTFTSAYSLDLKTLLGSDWQPAFDYFFTATRKTRLAN
jgi:hypothetical protein